MSLPIWTLLLVASVLTSGTSSAWFERISMLVILLNCITLGMYRPCEDRVCENNRCKLLQVFDDYIFAFFALEMCVKMIAMGVIGKGTYLADSWNRLDFFIVFTGAVEYCMNVQNMNFSAIRTIRVLRPLRAINRIPSMRILVMLLLDTLPMLGNVLLLCFFVFFIFGIVGVQLWEGILRQRCFLNKNANVTYPSPLATYYNPVDQDQIFICSKEEDNGMHKCSDLPKLKLNDNLECNGSYSPDGSNDPTATYCVNWNQYYTECLPSTSNPFQGTISFDNIGLAWVAIFLVISLEGWTDIMYYVQDAHSFWDWIYFVLLIVIGSFFMINLCLVVIATQFSETKKREMERMRMERERFRSTSTLASSTNNSEPTSCYAEIVKYVAHLWRRAKRRLLKKYHLFKIRREQQQEQKRRLQQGDEGNGSGNAQGGTMNLQHYSSSGNNGTGYSGRCATHHHHHHHHHHYHHHSHQHRTYHGVTSSQLSPPRRSEGPIASSLLNIEDDISASAPRASPEVSDVDPSPGPLRHTGSTLRTSNGWDGDPVSGSDTGQNHPLLLSPTEPFKRKNSVVMFSDMVYLHDGNRNDGETVNVCSSEKMTQAGDGDVRHILGVGPEPQQQIKECDANVIGAETMTCQELLALSGALSAALTTRQLGLGSFISSLSKGATLRADLPHRWTSVDHPSDMCCAEQPWSGDFPLVPDTVKRRSRARKLGTWLGTSCISCLRSIRRKIKSLVEHKYFQLGILFAILINTLSMGIEYHDQPEWLTVSVEISNIVFSVIFAIEMMLKIIADGPCTYVSNGFNVFDGIIVVLSVIEMGQAYFGDGEGSSGLSVLRTFRLLRILKLVRFMPNLRRQLFVMLRTMDNVAVFFSLLILFIFIFSILGMNLFGCEFCDDKHPTHSCRDNEQKDRKNFDSLLWALVTVFQVVSQFILYQRHSILGMYLFGGKFCMLADGSGACSCDKILQQDPECVCDRKHFNNFLWATVTVFQILTQEDWNVVLFNGMQQTSHWAALYFVALMTFGNYVLFNLLVAILVEGFSAERNERREREKRELAKQRSKLCEYSDNLCSLDGSRTSSSSSCYQELKNKWRSAEELRKTQNGCREKDNSWRERYHQHHNEDYEPKCNIERENIMLTNQPPIITHTAATPQDSPNTTLEPGMRDFNNRLSPAIALYGSSMSIDSIDRSMSSQSSIPGLLKLPNNKFNNLTPTGGRRVSLVTLVNHSGGRRDTAPSTPRIQRVCSWKISRPSLRRKSRRPSGSEQDEHDLVLNNGLNNVLSPGNHCGDHSHCNGSLLGTIRNNTQGTPNNHRGLSPQNSIRSQPECGGSGQSYWVSNNSSNNNSRQSCRSASIQYGSSCEGAATPINNLALRVAEPSPLPRVKQVRDEQVSTSSQPSSYQGPTIVNPTSSTQCPEVNGSAPATIMKRILELLEPRGCFKERDDCSLYLFTPDNRFRQLCTWLVEQRWFDNTVLLFIGLNCITLAMERPNIPPDSHERVFLATANYVFTAVFAIEMLVKVVATGMIYGKDAYFTSGWNIMDGSLVIISIIDLLMSFVSSSSPRIFTILRVFRLLRSLRPLRVINRAPGLKLVVQTLLSSLRPIGNIVLICCTFFIIFGILGVQLFKGAFYHCEGPDIKNVRRKEDCDKSKGQHWLNRKYNFDDLGKALMSLFVLSSRDGWVNIMYTGLDAVGVDLQPIENYSEWRLLYFIAFILLVGFFVLNMFVGVVVENFHRCREEQEKEERVRRLAKRAKQMEKRRRKMHEPPYYTNYSHSRLMVHNVVTSKYFDLAIAAVILLNVITMAMEFYMMPKALSYILKIFNYFFTAVFILEAVMKLVSLGFKLYFKDRWNQLDVLIVILSVVGIVLEELESKIIPINPTIIRVMRVLRIARVLKLLKMAKGIRALLDTVMQALPQVGNLGLLFFLLFFIFAALGVELFGRLECDEKHPCQGLSEHAHFKNFGMAFLTLFRVATGDNWNGIMKDTLREDCDDAVDCVQNCCVSQVIAPIFFVVFVLMAQFVLVNVVVAVLMKHLEESHKQMEEEQDMEVELERELAAEQEVQLLEEEEELRLQQMAYEQDLKPNVKKPLGKVLSLPANFTFSSPSDKENSTGETDSNRSKENRRGSVHASEYYKRSSRKNQKRRQTFHSHQGPLLPPAYPASGYTAIFKTITADIDAEEETTEQKEETPQWSVSKLDEPSKPPVIRLGSDSHRRLTPASAGGGSGGLLGVPLLKTRDMGSTKHLNLPELIVNPSPYGSHLDLWSARNKPHEGHDFSPTSPAESEDISPECVSPSVTLVPPTYGAATSLRVTSETHPMPENENQIDLKLTSEENNEVNIIIPQRILVSDKESVNSKSQQRNISPHPHVFVNVCEEDDEVGGDIQLDTLGPESIKSSENIREETDDEDDICDDKSIKSGKLS